MLEVDNGKHIFMSKKAFCYTCDKIQEGEYQGRDFVLNDGKIVPNILQLFCNKCDSTMGIRHEDALKIVDYLNQAKNEVHKS